jgi:hypothetical protein
MMEDLPVKNIIVDTKAALRWSCRKVEIIGIRMRLVKIMSRRKGRESCW